jgi:predicted outer membrane repeat protein
MLRSALRLLAGALSRRPSPARSRGTAARQARRARLELEGLEERALLSGNVFVVTSTADDGSAGTLRWAVQQANQYTGGADFIQFNLAANSDIQLKQGTLTLTGNTTIQGQTAPGLTITGGPSGSVFTIAQTGGVEIDNLTITGGHGNGTPASASTKGGAIQNDGFLVLAGITATNNTATTGGAVYNDGRLTVQNSNLNNNSASNGGGIFSTGSLDVESSNLNNDTATNGGGIYNTGSMTVNASILNKDTASSQGGGILNTGSYHHGYYGYTSPNMIENTTLSNDTAQVGGGVWNSGLLTVQSDTFASDHAGGTLSASNRQGGGAIFNASAGTVTVNGGTLTGNSTGNAGGAIDNEGTLTVSGTTVQYNSALEGGAIYNLGSLAIYGGDLEHNTATDAGGAISNVQGTTTVGVSSYLGGNSAGVGGAIYNKANLSIYNSTLEDNSATYYGGAVASVSGNLVMEYDQVFSNAAEYGGGIFNLASAYLYENSIDNNSATWDGGGIYNSGTLDMEWTQVNGNYASQGGGMYNTGTVSLYEGTLQYNYGGNLLNYGSVSSLYATVGSDPSFWSGTHISGYYSA